ncbi:unnamed protein product [Heterobilharzia americana]|nr:unnamed protein product [Heterobilharzia americana]
MDGSWFFMIFESDDCFKVKTVVLGGGFIFSRESSDPLKHKTFGLSLGPWSLSHTNISVFVLFHELYPVKDISTIYMDRDGILSPQDFIAVLHKMELESSLDEAYLQNNQLPLPLSRSAHLVSPTRSNSQTHCKPGTSSSTETYDIEVAEDTDIPVNVVPSPSPTLVTVFPPMSPTDSWIEQNDRNSVEIQSVSLQSLNLDSNEEQITSAESTSVEEVLVKHIETSSSSYSSEKSEHSPSSFNEEIVTHHQASESSINISQIDVTGNFFSLEAPTKSSKPVTDSQKTNHNSWPTDVTSELGNGAHQKLDFQLNSGSSSSLDDLHRYETFDDIKEFSVVQQYSSSSDSELDYKFDQRYSTDYNNIQSSGSLKSINTNCGTHARDSWLSRRGINSRMERKTFRFEHNKISNNQSHISSPIPCNINVFNLTELKDKVYDKNSSTCSSSTVSKRSDRHIRDIEVLEVAGVPFSYEDIIYSSNEEFRELRATPGLTEEQLAAMSDARRRATNRQAAERCRRSKVAVRDELAERLAQLRLQRQALTKRLIKARQRRREAR